jgi:MoxR-like ATPase
VSIDQIRSFWETLRGRIAEIVLGQEETLRLMTVALLSEGHVVLEGVPGTAKTLLARCFATCLALDFRRIQFTPDLMPGDIVGTNLFDFRTNQFTLTRGPIFTEFLLADEINRTPPKTQSALLEAMQERSVTIDGTTHPLSQGFMVVATENPIEHEGTYPLPEAQLDRFLFKILVDYPMPRLEVFDLRPITDLEFLENARKLVSQLRLADEMVEYVVDLVRATRDNPALRCGASPRASNMLATSARALAVLEGRDFVIPDDVKALFRPVMRHRLVMAPGAEVEGRSVDEVLGQVLDQVPAPR